MDGTQNMKRPQMSVIASSLALLGAAAQATTYTLRNFDVLDAKDFIHPAVLDWDDGVRGSKRRKGHSAFVNRGLPGHFHNPPRPRKRCQRRGRR